MGWALLLGLSAAALIVALIVAVVATPLTVRIRFASEPRRRWRIAFRLLGGKVRLPTIDTDRPRRGAGRAPAPGRDRAEKKPSRKNRFAGKGPRIARAAPKLVLRILRRIEIVELSVDGVFGLGDPADTGRMYGLLAPILFGVPLSRRRRVALRPDFERACLSGRADAVLRVTPAALVPPITAFAWRVFGPGR